MLNVRGGTEGVSRGWDEAWRGAEGGWAAVDGSPIVDNRSTSENPDNSGAGYGNHMAYLCNTSNRALCFRYES